MNYQQFLSQPIFKKAKFVFFASKRPNLATLLKTCTESMFIVQPHKVLSLEIGPDWIELAVWPFPDLASRAGVCIMLMRHAPSKLKVALSTDLSYSRFKIGGNPGQNEVNQCHLLKLSPAFTSAVCTYVYIQCRDRSSHSGAFFRTRCWCVDRPVCVDCSVCRREYARSIAATQGCDTEQQNLLLIIYFIVIYSKCLCGIARVNLILVPSGRSFWVYIILVLVWPRSYV